nr:3D domain-containing protein [Bacillus subtilis]
MEGYGYAIAADTGSAIKGNKIDVFFPEKSSAYRWGNKTVKIKILN